MKQETNKKVLLLENDPEVREKIQAVLENRPYETTCFYNSNEALKASKETLFDLVIAGHGAEHEDPIAVMKTLVMASPMSSIIMVTDLSDSEVDERAEGYGILGNIGRDVPIEGLFSLLGTYEKIQQALKPK